MARKKFASMIAVKAKAELELKMKGFKKLQEENEKIKRQLGVKEEEVENHREAETELMKNREKTMIKHLEEIAKAEDEKLEKVKEVNELEQEIQEFESKISINTALVLIWNNSLATFKLSWSDFLQDRRVCGSSSLLSDISRCNRKPSYRCTS